MKMRLTLRLEAIEDCRPRVLPWMPGRAVGLDPKTSRRSELTKPPNAFQHHWRLVFLRAMSGHIQHNPICVIFKQPIWNP